MPDKVCVTMIRKCYRHYFIEFVVIILFVTFGARTTQVRQKSMLHGRSKEQGQEQGKRKEQNQN